jgi:hypothetical protein
VILAPGGHGLSITWTLDLQVSLLFSAPGKVAGQAVPHSSQNGYYPNKQNAEGTMQRSMRVIRWMIWVSMLVAHPGIGQTDIQSLERLVKGQQKALLNFSGDPVARYRWQDGTFQSEKPVVRTLAIFLTDSISEKGNVLEFAGKRATLGFDSKHQSFGLSISEPMRLEVDLTGATTADAIPKAIGLLFFQSLKDAVAGVPRELADRIPYDVSSGKSLLRNCNHPLLQM